MIVAVLDTGPLGLATKQPGKDPEVAVCQKWIRAVREAGGRILVPAIADYEVRRELLRVNNTSGIVRLDRFVTAEPDVYLPLRDEDIKLAAQLWASSRQRGLPTADPKELDCDLLIAAQALGLGLPSADFVVETTNVGHLGRFVPAQTWDTIAP